ncbi:hypothetical protein OFN49_32820, partial [Escherichia coli]|nr:hypothetical protein [Escherichia coli]
CTEVIIKRLLAGKYAVTAHRTLTSPSKSIAVCTQTHHGYRMQSATLVSVSNLRLGTWYQSVLRKSKLGSGSRFSVASKSATKREFAYR